MSKCSPSTILFTIVFKCTYIYKLSHYSLHVNKWLLSMHESHLTASKISNLTCIIESNATLTYQSQ